MLLNLILKLNVLRKIYKKIAGCHAEKKTGNLEDLTNKNAFKRIIKIESWKLLRLK